VADVADELVRQSSELTRGDLLKRGTAAAFAIGTVAVLSNSSAASAVPTIGYQAEVTCTSSSGQVYVAPRYHGAFAGQWGASRIHVYTWSNGTWRYDGATPFNVIALPEGTMGGETAATLAGQTYKVGSGYKYILAEYRWYDAGTGWSGPEYTWTTTYRQQSPVSSPSQSNLCLV